MNSITFPQFVNWLFYGAMGFLAMRAVNSLDNLEASVSTLNEKVAVVIQVTSNHERQIEKQDERIRTLENNKRR